MSRSRTHGAISPRRQGGEGSGKERERAMREREEEMRFLGRNVESVVRPSSSRIWLSLTCQAPRRRHRQQRRGDDGPPRSGVEGHGHRSCAQKRGKRGKRCPEGGAEEHRKKQSRERSKSEERERESRFFFLFDFFPDFLNPDLFLLLLLPLPRGQERPEFFSLF